MSRLTYLPALIGTFAAYRTIAYVAGAEMPRYRVETAWIWFGVAALLAACVSARHVAIRDAKRTTSATFLLLIFVGLALLIYRPAIDIGLLSDDFVLLSWVRRGDLMPPEWPHVRLLPLAIWRFGLTLGGPSTVAIVLHIASIALHGANAFLVARLAVALGATRLSALAAALLFVSYPSAVEAVAWLSAMPDVLVTTFVLSAIVVMLTVTDVRVSSAIALLLTVAALLTKENAVVAGPLMLLTSMVAHPKHRRRLIAIGIASMVLTAAYLAWRVSAGRLDTVSRPIDRLTMKNFVTSAFAVLGLPVHGDVLRTARVVAIVWVALLSAALVTLSVNWPRAQVLARRTLFCGLWVLLTVAPAYGIIAVTEDLQASRYVYLSGVGWCILLAGVVEISELSKAPRLGRALAATLIAATLIAAIATTRAHLAIWLAASTARDVVLAAAASAPTDCPRIQIDGVPDNVRGAYVFRNGLSEALAGSGRLLHTPAAYDLPPECHVTAMIDRQP